MTPLDVARDEWPALRWRPGWSTGGFWLRGYDRRGLVVVAAFKRPGARWSLYSEHIVWHHAVSLRDGLRRVRWALP